MEVRMLKNLYIDRNTVIPKNEICKVRIYQTGLLQFNVPYQVIEGTFSGHIIPREYCINHSNEQTYSEKQVIAIENVHLAKLDKENEQKERAQLLVNELTKQLEKKNREIETLKFFVDMLSTTLEKVYQEVIKLKATNG